MAIAIIPAHVELTGQKKDALPDAYVSRDNNSAISPDKDVSRALGQVEVLDRPFP